MSTENKRVCGNCVHCIHSVNTAPYCIRKEQGTGGRFFVRVAGLDQEPCEYFEEYRGPKYG